MQKKITEIFANLLDGNRRERNPNEEVDTAAYLQVLRQGNS